MTIIQALSFIKIPKLDLSLDSQKITYARHNSSQGLNSVQEASQPSLMSMWDVRKREGRGEYPWCARSSLKRNGTKRVGERKAETMDCIWRKKGREREREEEKRGWGGEQRVNVVAVCPRGHEAITKLQKLTIKLGRHGARYHKTSRTTGQSAHIFGIYDQSRGRWERRGCPFSLRKLFTAQIFLRAGKKIATADFCNADRNNAVKLITPCANHPPLVHFFHRWFLALCPNRLSKIFQACWRRKHVFSFFFFWNLFTFFRFFF